MSKPLRTAVIGFGQIASGYAHDAAMARHYRYATHAQVLSAHPAFDWVAAVDPVPGARECARSDWGIGRVAADVASLENADAIEVAVIATPPESRLAILTHLPSLRAVLVEKPVGRDFAEASAFLDYCAARNIVVQVNLWRRADEMFRRLAESELATLVGRPQCVFGVYGNGLLNNGTHMVDFVRMLFGEVQTVSALAPQAAFKEGPIAGDFNIAFSMLLESGLIVTMSPLRFDKYRENGLDIWGDAGRLSILNEGLTIASYRHGANRAMAGEREIASDAPVYLPTTVGDAMYHVFTNLADAVDGRANLWSDAQSALRSSAVIEAVRRSAEERRSVTVDEVLARAVTPVPVS